MLHIKVTKLFHLDYQLHMLIMKASLEPPDIQCFFDIFVTLVSLYFQSIIFVMATEGQTQSEAGTAILNEAKIALMKYLIAAKAKMENSGIFKKQISQAAAEHIQLFYITGQPKTEKTCKTKYASV